MNTALLVAGAALLLVAVLSRWVTIGGNQIAKGAPWWVPVVVGAFGVAAIGWAFTIALLCGCSPTINDLDACT